MLGAIGRLIGWGGAPLPACYLAGSRERLQVYAQALIPLAVEVQSFDTAEAMLEASAARAPALVFLDLGLGVARTEAALAGLAAGPNRCTVQLVAPVKIETYEQIGAVGQLRLAGDRLGLKMPAALQPPYEAAGVKALARECGLDRNGGSGAPAVTLNQALKKNWLELWYQPKVDLGSKRLVGAEGLIRVRHPKLGTLFPGSFLPGADEADMLKMTEQVILTALRDWEDLARFGVSIRLSVNAPVSAFSKLPLAKMLREERPRSANWPGLILEVTEDEIVQDIAIANEVAAELRAHDCTLAIDDFGAGYSSLARLKQLPFCELKIDRSYVTDCNKDGHNAGLCETIVELAHRFGLKCVAEGIETPHESHKLQGVGCDVGQGYLFAKPMSKQQFLAVVQRRRLGTAELADAVRNGRMAHDFSLNLGAQA
jgi:EAL domain-containing protein (putative c-di-GMP-specific phosphodiesterase class I)